MSCRSRYRARADGKAAHLAMIDSLLQGRVLIIRPPLDTFDDDPRTDDRADAFAYAMTWLWHREYGAIGAQNLAEAYRPDGV